MKYDKGKPRLSLVPTQIIFDIAEVREYGVEKYHDLDSWKDINVQRYIEAAYRHWLAFMANPAGKDTESGIEHYKHVACNLAFICHLMNINNEKG